ncbi:MAG: hypothetical protein M3O31_12285 [Acidobacteriota bacterium]|nr:hypothetical protein [Acidobacteriota bacterium]
MNSRLHCARVGRLAILVPLLPCCVLFGTALVPAQTVQSPPLKLIQTIPLTARGPLAHMIIDRLNDRAFVAASAKGAVEIVDLKTADTITSIAGPGGPAELVYYKKCDCVAYSTSSGLLRILNPNTLIVDAEFVLTGSANAVGLDPQHGLGYVAHGSAAGKEFSQISFIDLLGRKNLGEIQVEGGRLGQMVLEHHGPRGYINNTATNQVMVIDLSERRIVDRWKVSGAAENVSIALDENDHRLFVGSRKPNTLVVIDTQTGAAVAHLASVSDVDDIAYDSTLKRVYLSGSEGFVDVVQQKDPDSYARIARIATEAGAATSKWVPEQGRLYVEVPSGRMSGAGRILVYEAIE